MLYVPVNDFSVMSGRFRLLGHMFINTKQSSAQGHNAVPPFNPSLVVPATIRSQTRLLGFISDMMVPIIGTEEFHL